MQEFLTVEKLMELLKDMPKDSIIARWDYDCQCYKGCKYATPHSGFHKGEDHFDVFGGSEYYPKAEFVGIE